MLIEINKKLAKLIEDSGGWNEQEKILANIIKNHSHKWEGGEIKIGKNLSNAIEQLPDREKTFILSQL